MDQKNKKVLIRFSVLFRVSLVLTLFNFYLLPTWETKAAVLYLEPSQGQCQPGDTFLVELRIDTEGECINAVQADLSFSHNVLKAIDFSIGDSILTLWIESPTINQKSGLVSFTGGIPGGYCGRIPGDAGASNLLGKMIFRVPGMIVSEQEDKTEAKIEFLDTSRVLLNDGLGTPAQLNTKGAEFTVLAEKLEISEDEWLQELGEDNVLPEPFEIEIYQEPSIFEGKYFLVFSTTDKQTGIDYYELKEGQENWKRVESPYVLEDQTFQSIIEVKAVDKSGNERIAEYIPEIPEIPRKPFPYWTIILVLLGAGIIWWIIKSRSRCKESSLNRNETIHETES